MNLYKVRDWEKFYENNRSRSVIELRWVPIPNTHDGESYSRLMTHNKAAEIFSAWILMLQVASRCQPRGTLLRSDGTPHSPPSLSLKTRAPEKWFELAIPELIKLRWLLAETHDCQETVSRLSAGCQAGDEEGRKGMEENGRDWVIPEPLNSDVFKSCWLEWVAYRKPLGSVKDWPGLWKRQLNLLVKMGQSRALAAIEHSMTQGWTGIFEPKNNGQHPAKKRSFVP